MLRKIWSLIVGEVRTVEHILGDFIGKVKELEQHAADKFAEAAQHTEAAAASTEKAIAAEAEAAKASAAAVNIGALVKGI